MTIGVDLGRKATKQTNKPTNDLHEVYISGRQQEYWQLMPTLYLYILNSRISLFHTYNILAIDNPTDSLQFVSRYRSYYRKGESVHIIRLPTRCSAANKKIPSSYVVTFLLK